MNVFNHITFCCIYIYLSYLLDFGLITVSLTSYPKILMPSCSQCFYSFLWECFVKVRKVSRSKWGGIMGKWEQCPVYMWINSVTSLNCEKYPGDPGGEEACMRLHRREEVRDFMRTWCYVFINRICFTKGGGGGGGFSLPFWAKMWYNITYTLNTTVPSELAEQNTGL